MSMTPVDSLLAFQDVSKTYGARSALRHTSFKLGSGKITGLLGSNGSGKTTLMKLAAGLALPSSGSVTILGQQPGTVTKGMVSFMPDQPLTEPWMRVSDALAFYRDFYPDFDAGKARDMLAFMRLEMAERVRGMSKGMSERLQLVLVLSRKARLYLLDEPLGGIDLVARERILDALVQYYDEGSSILVSTHQVAEIERIFDEVIFLRDGSIVMHEEVESIRLEQGKSIEDVFKEVYAEC